LIAGLEKYASFAEHANIAKAVDEALCAEKEGFDRARFGNALLQIAVNNSSVYIHEREIIYTALLILVVGIL
jgi:hypothetical protein